MTTLAYVKTLSLSDRECILAADYSEAPMPIRWGCIRTQSILREWLKLQRRVDRAEDKAQRLLDSYNEAKEALDSADKAMVDFEEANAAETAATP